MTHLADHADFSCYAPPQRHAGANRDNILRRIFNAVSASRRRHADLEIARFIARSGGRLTDDVERQLMACISQAAFGEPGH